MPEPTAKQLQNLAAFVLRARRVEAHSLNRDQPALAALASGTAELQVNTETGEQWLIQQLPEEEVVESAAARIRPILLKQDPVHWAKALETLQFYIGDSDGDHAATLTTLRDGWKTVMPRDGSVVGYSVRMAGPRIPEDAPALSDSDLSVGWFYGDVVHADTKEQMKTIHFGIRERYRAAVLMVARAVMHTVMTLNFIRQLQYEGFLWLPADVLVDEVVVKDPVYRHEVETFMAEVGTPMPNGSPGEGVPEGFKPFDPKDL